MADEGNENMLDASVEQQLSKIVKGKEIFSARVLLSIIFDNLNIFLADVRSGNLDLVTFVEKLGLVSC